MGEIVPGVAVIAVVLADRTPLPLAEVGAPFFPGDVCLARVVQSFLLGDIHHGVHFFGLQQEVGRHHGGPTPQTPATISGTAHSLGHPAEKSHRALVLGQLPYFEGVRVGDSGTAGIGLVNARYPISACSREG